MEQRTEFRRKGDVIIMTKKVISEALSFYGWTAWEWLKGRKKLAITAVGLICTHLALDPGFTALLAGGAVFEGVWAIAEFFFTKVKIEK
jgi:hypothetical protein